MPRKFSVAHRKHLSEAWQDRVVSTGTCKRLSTTLRGNRNACGKRSPETCARQTFAHLGRKNGMYGKHHSQDTRRKISLAAKLQLVDPHNNPFYGKHHTVESRNTMSKTRRNKWKDPTYANMVQSKLHKPTLPEAKVASVLHKMKLLPGKFEYNGQANAKVSIDGRIPDFVDIEQKVIIEVNGGFYHKNLNKFAERRAEKLSTYYANGYRVLEIWDYELLGNFDLNQLQDKINVSINIEDMH